jgi:serine phosphatase RsbU (regulator of sigma subunit)/anti-sigma regulatory factor (Ser/Thr protein kinase)
VTVAPVPDPAGLPGVLDPERLASVRRSGLLDPEVGRAATAAFERLAALAARLLDAPLAFVTVVDETRSYWRACIGVAGDTRQNPVEESFCQYVVADRAPFLVGDAAEHPRTRDNPSVEAMGVRAWAGAPLHAPDGHVLGSFCVVDTRPRSWTDEDADLLQVLAEAASGQVALLQAVDHERAARDRLRTLADASSLLLADLDPQHVLERLTALAVPRLATWCTAWLPEGGVLRSAAVTGPDGPFPPGHWPSVALGGPSLSARAYGAGEPQATDDLTGELRALGPEEAITAATAEADGGPAYAVPLMTRGRRLGAFTLLRRRGEPPFSDDDVELARALATRAAGALLLAQQYESQRHTAEVLQRSLLPAVPTLPGLEVTAVYRPAGGTEVGGDWYDVIDLGAGRVAVTIGDVMGRGVRAAAVMGQLRSALRALARLDTRPVQLLRMLDDVVSDQPADAGDAQIVTCFYGVLDPAEQTLTWANAGHVAPLLHRGGRAQSLPGPVGAPLGCGQPSHDQVVTTVAAGDRLCLFTDGLVEDRRRDLDAGLALLADVLERAGGAGLPQLADRLLDQVPAAEEDDVALLLLALPPPAVDAAVRPPASASFDVVGGAEAVGHVRHWAGGVLTAWGRSEEAVATAALLTGELLGNAVVHGTPPVTVRLRAAGPSVYLEVSDAAPQLPERRQSSAEDEGGRGLLLVDALTRRWGCRATGGGKVVWAELHDPGAA